MNVHCFLLDDSSYAYDLIIQDWRELGNLIGMSQYNYLDLSSLSMDSSEVVFSIVCSITVAIWCGKIMYACTFHNVVQLCFAPCTSLSAF